jgi:signal transduction histidine kinase/CheY-like chemotaxis protein
MGSHETGASSPLTDRREEPVVLLLPTGRDAAVAVTCLHAAGLRTHRCHDIAAFCAALEGAAAGLLAEEALPAQALDLLLPALQRQPVWSDVPLLLLTTRATPTEALWQFVHVLGAVGNVTLLERPLHEVTLLSTLRVALRSRGRQHELRQLHADLERRVAERTAALQQAHDALRHEMAERQRMQEALFQQEKLAALGTLLANVAHELNNPLAVASLQLDNLQEEGSGDASAETLDTLRQAIERCKSVVQSFLSLARQQPPTRQAVALNAVIGDVLVLLEHSMAVDGITVDLQLDEQVPPIWADATQLHHVVANLLTNAHHALRQTAAPRHLRLTTAAPADRRQVRLDVTDSGPGIPEALQRRVFEPFFTTKPQGVGSGLGLPLCRSIVEGHGGTIQLASQAGHGTTVSVTLPATALEVQVPEAVPEPREPVPAQRGAILLIDDEPGVQRALRQLLQRSGYDITTATNGQEGLAALEARAYAVILCDMRMPDLDGPGFYHALEHRHPRLVSRVIFLTGDVMSPEAEAFFAQVGRPRLVKPFNAQEVRRVIAQVLEAR